MLNSKLGTICLGLLMITAGAGALLAGVSETAAASPGSSRLAQEGCSYLEANRDGCTPAPEEMVAWYTLDEPASAVVAGDNIGDHHAEILGDPTPAPGMVAGAWTFDADEDRIRADHAATLNVGTGDLSIDAWVRLEDREGTATILKKMGTFPNIAHPVVTPPEEADQAVEGLQVDGVPAEQVDDQLEELPEQLGELQGPVSPGDIAWPAATERGYHFFVQDGELKLTLKDGANTETWGAQFQMTIGDWHHVAVTVDRDAPEGGIFYQDGAQIRTFDARPVPGLVNTFADLTAGGFVHPADEAIWQVDEIELFHRVLTAHEVERVAQAQEAGKCKTDCAVTSVETYRAGDGNSTADPRPALENKTQPNPADFDETRVNRKFGHSFQGLPNDIVHATLEVCLTPLGTLDENDGIAVQYDPVTGFDWYRRIGTDGASQGLFSFAWDKEQGQGTETLLLNLDALPTGNGYTSVIDSMNQNGYLDLYVQDDTSVCYAELTVVRCECHDLGEMTLQAGKEDGFDTSDGPEPATPGPELTAWQTNTATNPRACAYSGPVNLFDEGHYNECFGHTFQNLPDGIRGAWVEIRLKGTGCCVHTDSIRFQYENGQFLWAKNIKWLWDNGYREPGATQNWNSDFTLRIDLANLPAGGGSQGGGSILAAIDGGRLDVAVADDVAVDYIRLHLEVCLEEEPVPIYGVSQGDGIQDIDVANQWVQAEDLTVTGMENLATDETLDVLYTSADRGDLFEHALGQPGVTAVGPAHSGTALGDGHDGYLYLGQPFSPDVYRFQPGGPLQFVGADTAGANLGGDLATDPTTGVLYAATTAPATHGLVQVDRATGQQTPVTGSAGLVLDGLAFTCDGRMWGNTGAQLFEIDPSTGVAAPAFDLGFAPTDLSSQPGC